jgi:hypothetical protein
LFLMPKTLGSSPNTPQIALYIPATETCYFLKAIT